MSTPHYQATTLYLVGDALMAKKQIAEGLENQLGAFIDTIPGMGVKHRLAILEMLTKNYDPIAEILSATLGDGENTVSVWSKYDPAKGILP